MAGLEVWLADFPFFDANEEKRRTVLLMGARSLDATVALVKITSVDTSTVRAGEFGLYPSDACFKLTGLQKPSKVCFDTCVVVPRTKLVRRIGLLDIEHPSLQKRLGAAILSSSNRERLLEIGRLFDQSA